MSELSQDQRAFAALFAAMVEALDGRAPGFGEAFSRRLDEIDSTLTDGDAGVKRTLAWTKGLLRADHDRTEPASVVYAKNWTPEEDQLPSTDKVQFGHLEEAVQFWGRLPKFDQETSTIETASGHRFDATQLATLAKRYKERPAAS